MNSLATLALALWRKGISLAARQRRQRGGADGYVPLLKRPESLVVSSTVCRRDGSALVSVN
jgi:hypothetical protein